jgi:DNA-binding SARP family transcriptional activator
MRTLSRHILAVLGSALLVAFVWLLWDSRPSSATISTASSGNGLDDLLTALAWLGLLLIALGLLQRMLRLGHRPHAAPPRPVRHLRFAAASHPRRSVPATGGYADRAFPLIPKPCPAPTKELSAAAEPPDSQAAEQTARSTSVPAPRASNSATSDGPTISILGPLTITNTRQHGRRLRSATRELLCYLALHPDGAHRDQITDALWQDQSPEQGRNRLWRAVADARNHFGDTILDRDDERYQLNRAQIGVDLDSLHRLRDELEREQSPESKLSLLNQALDLFKGEPLAGSDFPWAQDDQRHLRAVHFDLLEQAARVRLGAGRPTAALMTANEGLASEPYNERLACLAMQAEAALGLRSAIINRYEQLTKTLDEQLGLQPGAETRRVYRQLLSQGAADSSTAPPMRHEQPPVF